VNVVKKYKFRVQVFKTFTYSQEAEVIVEAETGESATTRLEEMIKAFEEVESDSGTKKSSSLAEEFVESCDVDIRDYESWADVDYEEAEVDILEGPDDDGMEEDDEIGGEDSDEE
jgi:hypothetical protein